MIYKLFLGLQISIYSMIFNVCYSQNCANAVVPPATINGVNITVTSTGSVSTFLNTPIASCNTYKAPVNSTILGVLGPFTYTLNFNLPIDELDFLLTGTGSGGNENFSFLTNSGTPSIRDKGSCFTTIIGNQIESGFGSPQGLGGGGIFSIKASTPFTSLTISGNGGFSGSLFALCPSSIATVVNVVEQICAGDSVLINGSYQKTEGLYIDTIFGGNVMGGDSVVNTFLMIDSVLIDLGKDTLLCLGDTIVLYATSLSGSYLWQDNSTDSVFHVHEPGVYTVEVTQNNCSQKDTIVIKPSVLPVELGNDTILCQGDSLTLRTTNLNAQYLWNDLSMSDSLLITQPGLYSVEVTNNNCSAIDTIEIIQGALRVSLGNDMVICQGETVHLSVSSEMAEYKWQDNSVDSVFDVNMAGSYSVTVSNLCETVSDTINIEVFDCNCVSFPNMLTPNGDGINDTFYPKVGCRFEEYHLEVFSRWGEKVFESEEPFIRWDGTLSGKKVSDGVYFYVFAFALTNNIRKMVKGSLVVLN